MEGELVRWLGRIANPVAPEMWVCFNYSSFLPGCSSKAEHWFWKPEAEISEFSILTNPTLLV